MKNAVIPFLLITLITACVKQATPDEPVDIWNGYSKYLKMGEVVHTLWAGKNINIGTVTYGIDNNANFYVTYNCCASGWLISESHMFAGDKKDMPLNKPGQPKIGQFPNSSVHSPCVCEYTCRVPLNQLPSCENPGFVVASHCVVHNPSGQTETAWAEGDFNFTDKSWGWYDSYYYDQSSNEFTILYGTTYAQDTLKVYYINATMGDAVMILQEYVGNRPGAYDGAAYDTESGMFFFSNYSTGELWMNQLQGEDPSFRAGRLNGIAASGTFYNGSYYYIDENMNSINMVTFNSDWTISTETVLDVIPGTVTVNDIAMSPDGDVLYLAGQPEGGGTELISWNVLSQTFYTTSISVDAGVQIAYGSDGLLYAIARAEGEEDPSVIYTIDVEVGILTELNDGEIINIEDRFSDISNGPIM
jgi:hypothetical protein